MVYYYVSYDMGEKPLYIDKDNTYTHEEKCLAQCIPTSLL